ncbi:hypothetical protein SCHPADRAFT_350955 [Schizopora paradoxa]|uniref:Uncharacterized protein n=1 Tax=Schizopora paradoxa TaxID=27342 RepID=A0A0H2RP37_9AGAM|nr:hypothetical protein SCHPADRAFT_350955 [Schizopora paradoxa]
MNVQVHFVVGFLAPPPSRATRPTTCPQQPRSTNLNLSTIFTFATMAFRNHHSLPYMQGRNGNTQEGTSEFVEKMGAMGLLYVLEEVVRKQESCTDFAEVFKSNKWILGEKIEELQLSVGNQFDGETPSSAKFAELVAASCEADAMVAVLKTLTTIASGIQAQYDQVLGPSVSKLSKNIASIPDELLGVIFEAAVLKEGREGAKMARSLSHVSRRFRNVALAQKNLWATLRSNGSEEEWDMFISRSGPNAEFRIHIQTSTSRNLRKWDAFIKCCWQTAFRWTTLTMTRLPPPPPRSSGFPSLGYFDMLEISSRTYPKLEQEMRSDMEFVVKAFNGGDREVRAWHFPRLVELEVRSGDSDIDFSWTSPNLQVLRYSGQLPDPSAVFTTLTNFRYGIPSTFVVNDLLEFIASMPNLLDLQLSLSMEIWEGSLGRSYHFAPSPPCPSIVSFRLLVPFPRVARSQNCPSDGIISALLRALRIPNMAKFSAFIGVDDQSEGSELLNSVSCALLPVDIKDVGSLIRPSSIDYTIRKRTDYNNQPSDVLWTFPVPLERIYTVSCLTFSTCARVIFTHEGHTGEDGDTERCQLREIRFSGCEQMTIEDLRLTIQSLKEVGAWDTLERIVLELCDLVEYCAALEVVGMERLRYST